MTLMTSTLQNEIDELTQRHTSFKQKWLDKQRNIADLLASAAVACRTSVDDTHQSEHQQALPSDTIDNPEFERMIIDYLTAHVPISVETIAQVFSKEDEQINRLLKTLINKNLIKLDTDGKTVLSLVSIKTTLIQEGEYIYIHVYFT
jgi:hypothetical protein